MRRQNNTLAITLSVIALVLASYSTFTVYNLPAPTGVNDGDFTEKVNKVIDSYVAERSGQPQKPPAPIEVSVDDDPVKGDPNAPVTLVEFSDYECPFCGRFFNDTLPLIRENYIDTGKVKHVYRDFPLSFHPQAAPAANAAECIHEQGDGEMYFAYHDLLFENQTSLSVEKYKELAAQFEIDQDQFAECVDTEKYKSEVAEDFADGQKYGVQGTPGFFVNGVAISGAQPYAVFEAAIEQALNES